jgi:hypothetical protein
MEIRIRKRKDFFENSGIAEIPQCAKYQETD